MHGVTRLALSGMLMGTLAAAAWRAQEVPAPGPPLQVSVNRVMVAVNVTDERGRFAGGLSNEDFRVLDDEVEQPLLDFLPVEEPAQFLLVIEAGPAVLLFAKDHVLAADSLLT